MPVRSDPHPVVERFARVRETASARYGPDSQAITFLLYEELVSMRTLLARDLGCAPVRSRIAELLPAIQRRFDAAAAPAPPQQCHRTVSVDPTVIEFDRRFFEARYRPALQALGRRAVRLRDRDQALALLTTGASYLYAVDDEGALWVWPQPHRLADVMFGWAPGRPVGEPRVVHPMLVPDRLRVRAAGELVVTGSPEQVFVTANLKSGHFRPPRACAVEARRAVVSALELPSPADVDVFTMPPPTAPPTC
ncbi:hypothetical protein BX285_0987 [Streptomyces sp. 1114.5]|uniref:hypothetical protein n=1 Tax=unclassified Streptomyces TaxID=2593676 RepID=UPI000BD5075E|nr:MULTISPECIES: hypothetical protein [unclassified Streptomyces]RKT16641.1 hypothetical protein BX285_0987 [Streptomyces sp. 1114.5]SOB82812.1 hypothetical protein SAMN06272789_2995 [Streptomyces sp. 1331.2]